MSDKYLECSNKIYMHKIIKILRIFYFVIHKKISIFLKSFIFDQTQQNNNNEGSQGSIICQKLK